MNRKLKNTLALVGLLIFIIVVGGAYILFFQRSELSAKEDKLRELKANDYNTEQLTLQYEDLYQRALVLDSVLASRKFNIPQNLSSIKFYDFVTKLTSTLSSDIKVDVEFVEQKQERDFYYYEYKVKGISPYNDLYKFIYGIEQSKELKKISSVNLSSIVQNVKDDGPKFLVNFVMGVRVFFSNNNRFATAEFVENDLSSRPLYDAFYPLLRNEIPSNTDGLLDVTGAKLLALVPEGAFLSDVSGNTFLLWEGEPVYLGYLTSIDYKNNRVKFIINRGGVIEKVELYLEKEANKK
ncbi:MAG: hypothetical protein HXY50_08680 [Ignavibacteriaceae bacterium]|nr:hypothetical protein [Ignavibacteriaceae bacterium]